MFVGIDLGTSGLKAILVTDDQTIVAEAHAPLDVSRPYDGWSEQAPADWIKATGLALDELAAKTSLGGVRGIGLSGQMHGATLLDERHDVLRPCILWNDTRAHTEAAEMDTLPPWRDISGNIVFPGFTAPKLAWVRKHEPELFEKTALVLLPKDYLRLWLTGEAVSEMSDAAGTSWLDTGARVWSDALLAGTELSRDQMPRLVEGSDESGMLRAELAARWGIPSGTPVAGGGGDNAASAIGAGVVRDGEGFVSLGTSGVVFAANQAYRPDPTTGVHTFCHAVPDTWHQMGVILAATDALNWYANLVGSDAVALTDGLGALHAPGRGTFLPYLGGERTPHNDARIRGAFVGLDHATDRDAATRAVLEGVTFAVRDCFDALAGTGTQFTSILALGGGSRSDYWLSAIATSLGTPISVPVAGDFGGAYGAARLAMLATGASVSEVAKQPPIDRTIDPTEDLIEAFGAAHEKYKSTYQALKDLS